MHKDIKQETTERTENGLRLGYLRLLLFLIRVSSVFDPWLFLIRLRPQAALGLSVAHFFTQQIAAVDPPGLPFGPTLFASVRVTVNQVSDF
jgi:hypothetical protein